MINKIECRFINEIRMLMITFDFTPILYYSICRSKEASSALALCRCVYPFLALRKTCLPSSSQNLTHWCHGFIQCVDLSSLLIYVVL